MGKNFSKFKGKLVKMIKDSGSKLMIIQSHLK